MIGHGKRPAVDKLLSKGTTALVAIITAIFSCTPHEEPPELAISPEPIKIPVAPEPTAKLQSVALQKVTGPSGKLYDAVADVRMMLSAQILEAEGKYQEAAAQWFEALQVSEAPFGKRALEGWLKAYVKGIGKPTDRDVLAKLILAEARNGHYSAYMASRGLISDAAIVPVLEAVIPEWLTPIPAETTAAATSLPAPTQPIPAGDPLLTKTAASLCKSKASMSPNWVTWETTLPEGVRAYWNALVLQCQGKDIEALKDFKSLYPTLIKETATVPWGLEALSRAVALERAVGVRSVAADLYNQLMVVWQRPELTPKALGVEPVDMALRRINDTLWAGRYQALIADYEHAKVFAQSALEQVTNAYSTQRNIGGKDREALTAYKAEAYHDLAYRIALENKEFESALSLTTVALQIPGLTAEWRDRLQWFAGLYEYLGGQFEGAKRRWEAMLATTKDESQRSMLFFWLAKAYDQLDEKAESQFYITALLEEFPLSYYSVVAAPMAHLGGDKTWHSVFGSHQDMADRLVGRKDYGLTSLRKSRTIAPLLLRAEILVAADLDDWAKLEVNELDSKMHAELSEQSNVAPYIYLSRLHYNVGNYLSTIGITTKLSQVVPGFWKEWPEQLLVYFARPYSDVYDRMSGSLNIDKELLMAISRQESGFNAEIRSSANAVGVMQLIRPTALRFAAEAGIDAAKVDESLRNPEVNINLGSRYLKLLSLEYKNYPPAIFGAYNAGETAVDIWLKRRAHSDPVTFVELVPFGETKSYIRNVWRNVMVYQFLETSRGRIALPKINITPENDKKIEAAIVTEKGVPMTVSSPSEPN